MTRNDIEQAVYRWTGKATASPNTDTQTRIRHYINRRYRRLLDEAGLVTADDVAAFSSVANQSRYALVGVDTLLALRDTTNDRSIQHMSKAEYRAIAPDPSANAGTPTHFVPMGYEFVAKQPSDASELFLKSTAAGDTQTAYVELDITDGYPRTLSVSLSGTTAVSLSALVTTAYRVKKFYLASAAAGVVTLHEDSGVGTELARIGIGQTTQRYYIVHLYPQPSAVQTYAADVLIPITDLAQNTDEPKLPERFHSLLELGATMDELGKTDDQRYIVVRGDYEELRKDWVLWCAMQATAKPNPREFSRLGPWYPAGS